MYHKAARRGEIFDENARRDETLQLETILASSGREEFSVEYQPIFPC
jgi:hypothetical protein